MSILSVDQIQPIGSGTTVTLNATEIKTGNEITIGTGSSIFSPAGNTLTFGTNSTERLRITNAGAFGLSGTNYGSSGQVLTSQGSGSAPVWSTISGTTINNQSDNRMITCTGTSNTLNAEQYLTYTSQSSLNLTDGVGTSNLGGNYLLLKRATGNTNYINAPLANADLVISADENILFHTVHTADFNSTERARITSNGRVGINETSPDSLLHLTTNDSSAYSTSTTNTVNATNALLRLENTNGSDGSGVNNYVGVYFRVANGANSDAQLQYVRTGDNQGAFHFKARNAGSTYPNLMKISSAGHVTKPEHPSFHASRRGGDVSANNYVVFDQVFHNNGSHYNNSNGRFTAPVTGTYFFSAWNYTGGTSAFQLRINTSMYAEYTWDDTGGCGTWVCPMTAGQYAQIYTRSYTWRGTADYHNAFCGYLIG